MNHDVCCAFLYSIEQSKHDVSCSITYELDFGQFLLRGNIFSYFSMPCLAIGYRLLAEWLVHLAGLTDCLHRPFVICFYLFKTCLVKNDGWMLLTT